jgi:hypothetical protein
MDPAACFAVFGERFLIGRRAGSVVRFTLHSLPVGLELLGGRREMAGTKDVPNSAGRVKPT